MSSINYKKTAQIKIVFSALSVALFAGTAHADIDRGLTPHFINWLNANGYGSYGFERSDLVGGAYGGK